MANLTVHWCDGGKTETALVSSCWTLCSAYQRASCSDHVNADGPPELQVVVLSLEREEQKIRTVTSYMMNISHFLQTGGFVLEN